MTAPFPLLPLFADAGVPMIMLTYPAMIALLVPIIAIEAYLCKKWLGLTTAAAVKSSAIANCVSTIVGIPMAWSMMFIVELGLMGTLADSGVLRHVHSPIANVIGFFFSSAWIGPPDGGADWMIPCAVLALLVPFYLASYLVEYQILNHMLEKPEEDPSNRTSPRIRRAVRNANLVTYGLMAAGTAVWLMTRIR